ncbi:MAG TPA: MFS transporter [Myxococcota bacterium]|nr:MFS transporter [Myxococcota bacterium]
MIFVGEAMFGLPFHTARYFRATVLEAFGLSNAQLGDLFAIYGVTAALAYLPGGVLADRFAARKLMSISLIATGIGGLYMATIPSPTGMAILYGYWGVTTILLFWAALMRATREWGGRLQQGRAFGALDCGRGLVAASVASLAVVVFDGSLSPESALLAPPARADALRSVIHFYTAVTLLAGIACWVSVPDVAAARGTRPTRAHVAIPLRSRSVWAQALIVVCAYCGYKGLDNYALYAVDVLGMSELDAARFTAATAYIRPIAAIAAGFAADRRSARAVIGGLFLAMGLGYGALALLAPSPATLGVLYANILVSYFGVFGLRGVYFALLEETRVPRGRTGTAVGLISAVGFTPEIFFGPVSGRILDRSPGLEGHMDYFALLAAIAALGAIGVLMLVRLARQREVARDA